MSSEGSSDTAVTSGCGEDEMCTGRLFVSPVPPGLRGFLAVVARRGVWRLPVFFVVTGASESGSG